MPGDMRSDHDAPAASPRTAAHTAAAQGTGDRAPADTEIELKLAADAATLERLSRSPIVRARADGGSTITELESVYYDTPDHRLRRKGIAFRVRRRDGRFVQTVKVSGDEVSGVTQRGEWEAKLPSAQPNPAALTAPEATELLGALRSRDLQPVFTTRVKREVLHLDDGNVEIAFDHGSIVTDTCATPISELELELRQGKPAHLYRLALALHKVTPMRLECRSKAARGYALATGDTARSGKAKRVTLTDADTVETAMAAILRYGLLHWTLNEAAVLDGEDREGVHQMRVGLRRLRSALSLFRDVISRRELTWLRDETRWLAKRLGPARDLDVFQDELLAPIVALRPENPGMAALEDAIEEDRRESYELARTALRSPRYTTLVLRFGAWLEEHGWRGGAKRTKRLNRPIGDFAAAALQRRHKQARRAGRGFAALSPDDRHMVRIVLKKLRYTAEFFRSLYPSSTTTAYLKRLAALQDMLGYMNDVAVAHHLLGNVLERHAENGEGTRPLTQSCGLVVVWHNRQATAQEAELLQAWDAFLAAEPFWKPADG